MSVKLKALLVPVSRNPGVPTPSKDVTTISVIVHYQQEQPVDGSGRRCVVSVALPGREPTICCYLCTRFNAETMVLSRQVSQLVTTTNVFKVCMHFDRLLMAYACIRTSEHTRM